MLIHFYVNFHIVHKTWHSILKKNQNSITILFGFILVISYKSIREEQLVNLHFYREGYTICLLLLGAKTLLKNKAKPPIKIS